MAKKTTTRDKQALATRTKIYNCGIKLMNQHGYENITVEQIVKKANVSVGTFYHYFKSKFDLLGEVFRLGDVFFEERVPGLLQEHEGCAQRTMAYFGLYAQLSLNEGIEKCRSLYIPTNIMFITHGRAMQDMLTDILRMGQQNGELTSSLPAETITEKLFVVARGVIFDWCLQNGNNDLLIEMRDIMGRQMQSYLIKKQDNPKA